MGKHIREERKRRPEKRQMEQCRKKRQNYRHRDKRGEEENQNRNLEK